MVSPYRHLGVAATIVVLAVTPLAAQQPDVPGPAFRDILDLRDIGAAVISPDRQAIAYTVRSTDWDENGYDTEIFELHSLPGGLCTAWQRDGYTFDGCIHWLMGSSPGSNMHEMWRELHAVQDRLRHGRHLPRGSPPQDQQEVGVGAEPLHIQQYGLECLFFQRPADRCLDHVRGALLKGCQS